MTYFRLRGRKFMNKNEYAKSLRSLGAVLNELKRRENIKIYNYNTGAKVHQKQLLFHKSPKRNRWVFGGNRTGKTECGAVECVYMARGIHPYRENRKSTVGFVVSVSTKVQKDVAQKKILSYLDPMWIDEIIMQTGNASSPENGVIERIVVNNVSGEKSTIIFKSAEEGREKFQGASLDYVWFDEEPPEDIYNECYMRVLDKKGDIFGTMTPLKGLTFVYNKIYLNEGADDEVFCIFMDWSDNPFLDAGEVKRLSSLLSAEELEARKYGRFVSRGAGLVYPEFDENETVVEPFNIPDSWQDKMSIDPGLNNPLSVHWYAVDPYTNNIYVVAEHYEAERNIDYHAEKIKEVCKMLNWHKNSFGTFDALIDSAALQTTLNGAKSVAELFRERGIAVNPKVNKDLFSGISKVKSLLKNVNGERKLFIFKTCVNMIREIKGYRWGNSDSPIKKDDHSMDELRYYCNQKTDVKPPAVELNEIQRDKARLYRNILRSGRRQN